MDLWQAHYLVYRGLWQHKDIPVFLRKNVIEKVVVTEMKSKMKVSIMQPKKLKCILNERCIIIF